MSKLLVDNREIEAAEGASLLDACLDNGIYIPNLCYIKDMAEPPASCRLCFVEVEGEERPVPSCTVTVRDGLVVRTDTPAVRDLQRAAFRLLMSVHDVDCANCPANRKCELQKIAGFLRVGLKPTGLDQYLKQPDVVKEHPFIWYYPNRCVLCGRCVHTCVEKHGRPIMDFARRGFDTIISLFGGENASPDTCETCLECTRVCPVAALLPSP